MRAASVLLLVGCAARRPERTVAVDVDAVRQVLVARASRPLLFDGELRINGSHARTRFRARVLASAAAGGRLWLESSGPFAFVLGCNGQELRVILPRERRWLRLPATAASVEELVGLPLDPEELGAILAGAGAPAPRLERAERDGERRLRLPENDWLEVAEPGARVVAGQIRGLSFRVEPGGDRIEFRLPRRRLEMRVRLVATPDVPGSLPPDELFQPQAPADFVESLVQAGSGPILLPGGD